MNYKDTVLKDRQLELKWKRKRDGRMDIIIPLTDLLELQAQTSMLKGVQEVFSFFAEHLKNNTAPTTGDIQAKMKEWFL